MASASEGAVPWSNNKDDYELLGVIGECRQTAKTLLNKNSILFIKVISVREFGV